MPYLKDVKAALLWKNITKNQNIENEKLEVKKNEKIRKNLKGKKYKNKIKKQKSEQMKKIKKEKNIKRNFLFFAQF